MCFTVCTETPALSIAKITGSFCIQTSSVDSNFSSENAVTELTKYATERYCSGQDVDIWAVGRMQEKAKDIRGILEDKGMRIVLRIHHLRFHLQVLQ